MEEEPRFPGGARSIVVSSHAAKQMKERNIPNLLISSVLTEPHSTREGKEGRWIAERYFSPEQWPKYTRSTKGYTVMVVYVLEDAAEEVRKTPFMGGLVEPSEEHRAWLEEHAKSLEGELVVLVVTVIKTTKKGGSR